MFFKGSISVDGEGPGYIISLEGNIGSGKSTLFKALKETCDPDCLQEKKIIFLEEPVDEWCQIKDTNNHSILDLFYQDMNKYAFSFQMMAYISRLKKLKETVEKYPNAIVITERCLQSDKNIFAKMLHDDGHLNSVEYQIYNQWFDYFSKDLPRIFYVEVRTSPLVCLQRIQQRNRKGEESITLPYLTRLHNYHKKWLTGPNKPTSYIVNGHDSKDTFGDHMISILNISGLELDASSELNSNEFR